jgi:hypothetical protein
MSDLPIACNLTAAELRESNADLLPALAPLASEIRAERDAIDLEFTPTNAILERLTRVMNRERTCCAFLQFTLRVPAGGAPFRFHVDGPPGTGAMLASLHPAFAAAAS